MLNAHYIVSFIKENAEGWWSTSHTHTLTHTKYLVNRYSGPSIQRRIVILFFFYSPPTWTQINFWKKRGKKWNEIQPKRKRQFQLTAFAYWVADGDENPIILTIVRGCCNSIFEWRCLSSSSSLRYSSSSSLTLTSSSSSFILASLLRFTIPAHSGRLLPTFLSRFFKTLPKRGW